ncbi:MAG: DUF1670 domain-containing protein [Bacillota bacterium]
MIAAWREFGAGYNPELEARLGLGEAGGREGTPPDPGAFYELLRRRHGYSPAAAEAFLDELHDIAARLNRQEREGGQIIYRVVSAHELPGKKLAECALVPVTLGYVTAEDWELADRDNAAALKWARLTRFTVQAKNQGAVLTQPDLAHLLGLSTSCRCR